MDIFTVSQQAVMHRSALAYPLAALFGVVSSLGPCAVTRYAAVARATSTARRPMRTVGVFIGGLVVTYALFGIFASLLAVVQYVGTYLYLGAGVAFLAWGLRTAWRGPETHCDVDDHDHSHEPTGIAGAIAAPATALRKQVEARFGTTSLASVFVLGVMSACMISPCCAPFLGLTIGVTAAAHDPLFGASVLSVFAIGHAVPLIFYGIGGAFIARSAQHYPALNQAVSIAFGALMIAVGASYLAQI